MMSQFLRIKCPTFSFGIHFIFWINHNTFVWTVHSYYCSQLDCLMYPFRRMHPKFFPCRRIQSKPNSKIYGIIVISRRMSIVQFVCPFPPRSSKPPAFFPIFSCWSRLDMLHNNLSRIAEQTQIFRIAQSIQSRNGYSIGLWTFVADHVETTRYEKLSIRIERIPSYLYRFQFMAKIKIEIMYHPRNSRFVFYHHLKWFIFKFTARCIPDGISS